MAGNDSNKDRFKDNVTHDGPSIPSQWLVNRNDISSASSRMISQGNSMVEASSAPSAPVLNYSCPPIWEEQSIDVHSLGYCDMNAESNASSSGSLSGVGAGANWMPNAMLRDGMFMLPHSLPPLPSDLSDPAFIERAARFSCFSGGTFSEILTPFSFPNPINPCSRGRRPMQGEVFTGDGLRPTPSIEPAEGEFENEKPTGENASANQCGRAECSGLDARQNLVGASAELSVKGVDLKKRKRAKQKPENHEDNKASEPDADKANDTAETRGKGHQCLSSRSNLGKKEMEGSDPPEEGYIHVRARRGQATNSHSLAERIRREKISERMKHLQDLVPGCNKVTGKAVMLDEIINYVQSLQRQVEFLSMKLATVNPQLEFNKEGFAARDILQSGAGLSPLLTFPPDITMPFPPQCMLNQAGLPGKRNSSVALHMPISLNLAPGVWEDALHNGLSSSSPFTTQDISRD